MGLKEHMTGCLDTCFLDRGPGEDERKPELGTSVSGFSPQNTSQGKAHVYRTVVPSLLPSLDLTEENV